MTYFFYGVFVCFLQIDMLHLKQYLKQQDPTDQNTYWEMGTADFHLA